MILCHEVGTGPLGNTALLDLMAVERFPEFPYKLGYKIYINLAGGKGMESFRFEVRDPGDGVLQAEALKLEFAEPSKDHFLVLGLGTTFRGPGLYMFRLWYGDSLLAQRSLTVDYPSGDPRARKKG